MAEETDINVVRIDGMVHMLMIDEIVSMSPTDAWVLGNALVEKAQQQEDDDE